MTKNLLNLSGKIDALWVSVFQSTHEVASNLQIPFFVVGAAARDLILEYGFGVDPLRATKDIDLAVKVPDWETYEQLMIGLASSGRFATTKQQHRLMFDGALPVDIIPFGPIATPDTRITWPEDPDFTMNMLGFEEAYEFSLNVRLKDDPILEVQVSAPQSLAILKLISWNERAEGVGKDAADLFLIICKYLDLGNDGRLASDAAILRGMPDFDYERAGARLLGRDMAASCNAATGNHLLEILVRETGEKDRYRLVEAMGGRDIFGDGGRFEKILDLLENVRIGFSEKMGEKGGRT
jgi:predicted nucleotidyltransferase